MCAGGAACSAYQRLQESEMRRDLTKRMMNPLTPLEMDAVTSGRRNKRDRKGRAERNVRPATLTPPPPPLPYTGAALCLGMTSTVHAAKGPLSLLCNSYATPGRL